jgi:hypothetical protein
MTTSRTTTGIPALAAERATHVRTFPLVVVGGPLTFSNPVPGGPFADVIVMGEAEELLPILVNRLRESPEREALLHDLAQRPLNPVRGYSGTTEEIPRTVEASELRTLGPTGADSKLPSVGDHRRGNTPFVSPRRLRPRSITSTTGTYTSICPYTQGGTAQSLARAVVRVDRVFQLEEFGAPEAMWVIEVKDLPTVVTMDAQGGSPHESIAAQSKAVLERLLGC